MPKTSSRAISHLNSNITRESISISPNMFLKTHPLWPSDNINAPTIHQTIMFHIHPCLQKAHLSIACLHSHFPKIAWLKVSKSLISKPLRWRGVQTVWVNALKPNLFCITFLLLIKLFIFLDEQEYWVLHIPLMNVVHKSYCMWFRSVNEIIPHTKKKKIKITITIPCDLWSACFGVKWFFENDFDVWYGRK